MPKRTLDSFFTSPLKKQKIEQTSPTSAASVESTQTPDARPSATSAEVSASTPATECSKSEEPLNSQLIYTSHATYPFPIANFPLHISEAVEDLATTSSSKVINDRPHLDLLYFQPLISQSVATQIFHHLRSNLPFYRVKYTISRFGKETQINTPRFTTVFGLDETSRFVTTRTTSSASDSSNSDVTTSRTTFETKIVETSNMTKEVGPAKYRCKPRPIPPALALLLNMTEALTGDIFNFCLVNYYATGSDSISYHSDDERFLGHNPSIASFTLGARRDFLMKHKPPEKGRPEIVSTPLKLSLGSGDMVVMRGETQSNWLHSIPKRKGGEAERGRINITLRRAMTPGGTENYYRYNVGDGEVYRWNEHTKEMLPTDSAQR